MPEINHQTNQLESEKSNPDSELIKINNIKEQYIQKIIEKIEKIFKKEPLLIAKIKFQGENSNNQNIEVKTKEVSLTNRGNINSMTLSFGKKDLTLGIRVTNEKLELSLEKEGVNYHRNQSVLISTSEDPYRIKFEKLSWRSRGADFDKHIRYWYSENNEGPRVTINSDFAEFKIIQNDQIPRALQIQDENLPIFIDDLEDTENIRKNLEKAVAIHVHCIIFRCLDWMLYNALNNAQIDAIDSTTKNKETIGIASHLFGQEIIESIKATKSINFITPFQLKKECEAKKLYYSQDVYQTIAASMNLGRHLILTGAPGCGKSRLAEVVGELLNGKRPKIVTASPAWTSGEIVGRYFPRLGDGQLRFHPGIFLQAAEDNCCLVIDEMNRANLDECMGELFTVLAGQIVDLPYMDSINESSDIENAKDSETKTEYGYIKIIPYRASSDDYPENSVYRIGEGFRLIGTMNDSDRSALHNLSFALLRRFDVIKIKSPNHEAIKNIIKETIEEMDGNKEDEYPSFKSNDPIKAANAKELIVNHIEKISQRIFYPEEGFGLIKNQIIGISTLIDIIQFCLESVKKKNFPPVNEPPSEQVSILNLVNNFKNRNKTKSALECLISSIFSLGLVIKVIPQLDALEETKFQETIKHIKESIDEPLDPKSNNPQRYSYPTLEKNGYAIAFNTTEKISTHFLNEVKNYYQGTAREDFIEKLIHENAE